MVLAAALVPRGQGLRAARHLGVGGRGAAARAGMAGRRGRSAALGDAAGGTRGATPWDGRSNRSADLARCQSSTRARGGLSMSVGDRVEISDVDQGRMSSETAPWQAPGVNLPWLGAAEAAELAGGGSVMRQNRTAGLGEGFVVMDVDAPPEKVWRYLSDYQGYRDFIPTVRDAVVQRARPSANPSQVLTPATFKLSRFRLRVNVLLRRDDARWNLGFELDPKCKNLVLQRASGYWQLQPYVPADAAGDAAAGTSSVGRSAVRTRVWLCARVEASRLMPAWLVDYAAQRAFKRATQWIKPTVEGTPMVDV